jgi:hypothetical protein
MDGASLEDAVAIGAYFDKSALDAASVENADYEIRKLIASYNVVGQYGFFGRRFDRSWLGRYEYEWSLAQGCRCNRSQL